MSFRRLLRAVGPGILMAGAAIGVSHLMQSTRAGATFGTQLVIVVLAINLFKYPFFEYGHRYAVARRESLLHGYLRMGRASLYLFFGLNCITAVISIAGVSFVTAALTENLIRTGLGATARSAIVMAVCLVILLIGHYRWLDRSMKLIMAALFLTTVTAFIAAVAHGGVAESGFQGPDPWQLVHLGFLVALMGWMPAPIELSVWQSLWIQARERDTGHRCSWQEASFDFNLGYLLTTFLAVLFLMLGALVMYGSGEAFATSNVGFATQLVDLYRRSLGAWVAPVVAIAAFTAMFSTTLTVIDAYPRSLAVATRLSLPGLRISEAKLLSAWTIVGCGLGVILIQFFLDRFTALIDLATTVAFLAAPVFGYLNYRLITSPNTPTEMQPGTAMRVLSWLGLVFFSGVSLLFLVHRYLPQLID